MRRRQLRLPAATVLALSLVGPGCAYVGQSAFEAKRDSLDHDKDGAPYGGPDRDCNDFEELENPANDEIPYDGFDNDCDGADVVDADGDGYPGILKSDYLAQNKDAEWPSSVVEGPLDCADDPVVWPDAAQIFPGNPAGDAPYDGKDSDCAGDNDFDRDGDGYVPDEWASAFDDYVLAWGLDGLTAQFGDCNDFRIDAHPGVAPADDDWYDGHDDDCAGNNDFDADADGYMFDEDANAQKYEDFVDTYHADGVTWAEAWGDCLDLSDPRFDVAPADVWPENPADAPYDGIDADCACDNDFDADFDGVMPDSASDPSAHGGATFDLYVQDWGCTLPGDFGDCDDDDDRTAPGALEVLGDLADSDCDGNPDGTPFGFGRVEGWRSPRQPTVIRTDGHYLVLGAAEACSPDGTGSKPWAGLALPFELDSGYDAVRTVAPAIWVGGGGVPLPLGNDIDAVARGMEYWASASYRLEGGQGYLSSKQLGWMASQYTVTSTEWDQVGDDYIAESTDVILDANDHAWTVSCGQNTLQVVRGDNDTTTSANGAGIAPSVLDPDGVPAGVCFWNDVPVPAGGIGAWAGTAEFVACDPGVDCTTYLYDAATQTIEVALTNPWAGRQLERGEYRDGWFILEETGSPGVRVEGDTVNFAMLTDWNLLSVDVSGRDTDPFTPGFEEAYAAAVAEPLVDDGLGPRVVVSSGPVDGPFQEIILPFSNPARDDLVVDSVGVHVDQDRLVVAVSAIATDPITNTGPCLPAPLPDPTPICLPDALGWVFFGLP